MKLKEQVLKSYLLLSAEHVNIMSTLKKQESLAYSGQVLSCLSFCV
jgi:hypothetical protein